MINFNVPPHSGNEEKYIAEAISNHKICGDGSFTKKCNDEIDSLLKKNYASLLVDNSQKVEIDKYVIKATYAKMARGEMLRFMTTNKIEDVEDIKKFNSLNYVYLASLSDDNNFYFERIV